MKTKKMETTRLVTMIGQDWNSVTSPRKLKARLLDCIQEMRIIGMDELADSWTERLANMPMRMNKDAVNYVLLTAYWEVQDEVKRINNIA